MICSFCFYDSPGQMTTSCPNCGENPLTNRLQTKGKYCDSILAALMKEGLTLHQFPEAKKVVINLVNQSISRQKIIIAAKTRFHLSV